MKTKIIYISGSEVFEMADVRAAFDEVRHALGLGRDTVLFGVPVDNDDALASSTETEVAEPAIVKPIEIQEEEPAQIIEEATTPIIQDIIEPEIEEKIEIQNVIEDEKTIEIEHSEIAPVEVKSVQIDTVEIEPEEPIVSEMPAPVKKSRGRPRKVVTPADEETEAAPVASEESIPAEVPEKSEKVIPILSVLAANSAPVAATETEDEIEEEEPVVESSAEELVAEEPEAFDDIDDMIAETVPEDPIEKTLEQLLESMTPLREDHGENIISSADDEEEAPTNEASDDISALRDADATLEKLAAEFANSEDKIAAPMPTQSQGKIGKLKNILPFKKARREDSGLMGDLFGWAGVAANDEDFTIPGFFTTAASKK